MGEITQPVPKLVPHNLETSKADRSPHSRSGVKKPVELLIKSLNELVAESHEKPYEAVTVMHQTYEKERRKLLHLCREGREKIVKKAPDEKKSRAPLPPTQLPALVVVGRAVRESSRSDCCSPHTDGDDSSPPPQHSVAQGFIRSSSAVGKPPPSTTTYKRKCALRSLRPRNHNNKNKCTYDLVCCEPVLHYTLLTSLVAPEQYLRDHRISVGKLLGNCSELNHQLLCHK